MPKICRVTLLLSMMAGFGPLADSARPASPQIEFFETNIRPVLAKHCYQCHSQEAENLKAGLRLDTGSGLRQGGNHGPAIVPGKPQESLLIKALRSEGPEMPPTGQLPQTVIDDFVQWIAMGAPVPRSGSPSQAAKPSDGTSDEEFWAFGLPRKPAIPEVDDSDWPQSEIDHFLRAKQEEQGLQPVGKADRRTLIRRASFDLIGLPPTPAQVEAYLDDSSPKAFAKVVDRLLASPRFGERWGRHWLDVARYAESTGQERNLTYPYAWRYRNYVIDSFNKDKPYNRFIKEQVAGDLLPDAGDEERIATGFLAIGPKSLNGSAGLEYTMDVVDDQINVTCRSILALTVNCARCHDHKFDPIPTKDYYALAGIFKNTEILAGVTPKGSKPVPDDLIIVGGDEGRQMQKAYEDFHKELASLQKQIDQTKKKRRQAKGDFRKARKKLKEAQKQDDPQAIDKLKQNVDKLNAKRDQLKNAFQDLIAERKEFQKQAPPRPPKAMAVRDVKKPSDFHVLRNGDVNSPGEDVPRGFVQAVMGEKTPQVNGKQSGRLQLADWLASQQNPLTARVMVNRIWQHLFGRGLVPTVDNFGRTGQRPSHPKLLDYLAVRFMEEDWSIKTMIRTIMLSRAYRLSSRHDADNYEADPANRYLWRMSRRRLEAESIRDAMLAVSGQLRAEQRQGSSVYEVGLRQRRDPAEAPINEIGRGIPPKTFKQHNSTYRSIYLPVVRNAVPEILDIFDVADPSMVVGNRKITTVAPQALYMVNSPFVVEQSRHFAKRLLQRSELSRAQRIDLAYQLALARPTSAEEQQQALKFFDRLARLKAGPDSENTGRQTAWARFCQVLFASAEFRYVY